MPTKEELDRGFRLGDWEVIPSRRMLRCGDDEVTPEPKVFGVLMSLALRGGDGVTRDELIDEVWDGRPTGDEPINRAIAQLRGHLGDTRPYRYIKALTGSGYLLQEAVVLNEPQEVVVDDLDRFGHGIPVEIQPGQVDMRLMIERTGLDPASLQVVDRDSRVACHFYSSFIL